MNRSDLVVLLILLWPSVKCYGQGTLHITFDGPPPQPPGTAYYIQEYGEAGISFTPLLSFGFARVGSSPNPGRPDNGSAYLQATLGNSLVFRFVNNSLFSLAAVDLAEYSTVVPDAVTVLFVGYRHDGLIVTTNMTTDGIIDGTGPLADFEMIYFDDRFTGLDRVEIPTYGWSLDNLFVRPIPEPASGALMLVGGLLFSAWRRVRREQAKA